MKKIYFSPKIKVATFRFKHRILESSWLKPGDGEVEAKGCYGSWELDDEDE